MISLLKTLWSYVLAVGSALLAVSHNAAWGFFLLLVLHALVTLPKAVLDAQRDTWQAIRHQAKQGFALLLGMLAAVVAGNATDAPELTEWTFRVVSIFLFLATWRQLGERYRIIQDIYALFDRRWRERFDGGPGTLDAPPHEPPPSSRRRSSRTPTASPNVSPSAPGTSSAGTAAPSTSKSRSAPSPS